MTDRTPPRMRPTEPSADMMAASVTATMVTGPILFALLGWFADRWLGTEPWLVLIGLLTGMALALYTVWIRYGTGGRTTEPGDLSQDDPAGDQEDRP